MAEEPQIFSRRELVEFHEDAIQNGAPKGIFEVHEIYAQLETQVILYIRLRPDATFRGHRVERIPPNMLKKVKTEV